MEEDPALYRRFSDMIDETINKFIYDRITEKEYLERMKEIKQGVQEGAFSNTPQRLKDKPQARSFYHTIKEEFDSYVTDISSKRKIGQVEPGQINDEMYVRAGLDVDEKSDDLVIVDWTTNPDIKDEMFIAIEDYMIEFFRKLNLKRDFDVIERIAETIIKQKESRASRK